MTSILTHLQTYVPSITTPKKLDMEPFEYTDYKFVKTLLGGDQLSTARARGCMMIQDNSENSFDKIHGLLPVSEDWHAKVCFMEVSQCVIYSDSQLNDTLNKGKDTGHISKPLSLSNSSYLPSGEKTTSL